MQTQTTSLTKLAITLDGILAKRQRLIDARAEARQKLIDLRAEMHSVSDAMVDGTFDPDQHRDGSKIVADMKRINNNIDRDIDVLFQLTEQGNEAMTELANALNNLPSLSLDSLN